MDKAHVHETPGIPGDQDRRLVQRRLLFLDLQHFSAVVVPALRADSVWNYERMASRTLYQGRRLELPVRPSHIPLGCGLSFLGNCHIVPLLSFIGFGGLNVALIFVETRKRCLYCLPIELSTALFLATFAGILVAIVAGFPVRSQGLQKLLPEKAGPFFFWTAGTISLVEVFAAYRADTLTIRSAQRLHREAERDLGDDRPGDIGPVSFEGVHAHIRFKSIFGAEDVLLFVFVTRSRSSPTPSSPVFLLSDVLRLFQHRGVYEESFESNIKPLGKAGKAAGTLELHDASSVTLHVNAVSRIGCDTASPHGLGKTNLGATRYHRVKS